MSAEMSPLRPELTAILKKLKLDYTILSSSGNYLQTLTAEGQEKTVLDLICGYGSCLLGHNHPHLIETMVNALQGKMVSHAQLSLRTTSGTFAQNLAEKAQAETSKSFIVTLANTGAEAIEAAMKHALLAYDVKKQAFIKQGLKTFNVYESQANGTSKQELNAVKNDWLEQVNRLFAQHPGVFIALEGAFHGKTLGALSITHNKSYRNPFTHHLIPCEFIDPKTIDSQQLLDRYAFTIPYPELLHGELIIKEKSLHPFVALVAEPIQGEAGVFPLSMAEAQNLSALSKTLAIPLVWDEIQSGSFRTGQLFASSTLGVEADYYVLGKALGGGQAKVSALLVEEEQYQDEFGLIHTSTFAEDELSSTVANASLNILSTATAAIAEEAQQWEETLQKLAKSYPQVIKEVRGSGLIWGIEFHDFYACGGYGFQALSRGGYFNYLVAAWLFNHHTIRFSAPLSHGHTLRMHPPLGCTAIEREKVAAAIGALCEVLKKQDLYCLLSFLFPTEWQHLRTSPLSFKHEPVQLEQVHQITIPKAGFITHYIDEQTLQQTDPSLTGLPLNVIEELLENFQDMLSPVITGARRLTVTNGENVHLTMIGCPFTSTMAKQALEEKNSASYRETLNKAIALLEEVVDPDIIGLGQYTSIISNNGLLLAPQRAQLTTGNGLTASLAVEAILNECKRVGIDCEQEYLAVIGASGNIGSLLATLLLPYTKGLLLVGNLAKKSNPQLQELHHHLTGIDGGKEVKIATSSAEIAACRLIVAATNEPHPFLNEGILHPQAILCDVSVPLNTCESVLKTPGERSIFLGGMAHIPDRKPIPGKGIQLPEHQVYGCLAETLVLALAQRPELASMGKLSAQKVKELMALAHQYGFIVPSFQHTVAEA